LGKNIVDVGCADGSITSRVKKLKPRSNVIGVDLYKKAIDFAKRKHPKIKFLVADARKLPFKKNSVDSVLCVETLEHVPNNKLAVAEIARILKKGGKLIVCQDSDNLLFNFVWFFWTKWKGKVWDGSHISCMKPVEIENMLKDNGFEILKVKFSHFGMEVVIEAEKK